MCDNPVKYLSADSLPKDASICELSKLTHGQVANLWNHWAKRQKAHVQGVEFISARPHDRQESMKAKGKKKAAAFINPGEHDQPQAGDDPRGGTRGETCNTTTWIRKGARR